MSKSTYYLLRSHIDFEGALEICQKYFDATEGGTKTSLGTISYDEAELKIAGFHRKRTLSQPGWMTFVTEAFDLSLEKSGGSTDDAILVISCANRTWVLTFGALHGVAKTLPLERRFGVVAVSNASTPDEVRQIAAHSHGASSMYRLERRGKKGDLTEFLVSRLARRASKVASKVTGDVERPVIIEGGLGVYYNAPQSIPGLASELRKLLGWWNGGEHIHDSLKQLDKVRDAEDEVLIAQMDQQLHNLILDDSELLGLWSDSEAFFGVESLSVVYHRILAGLNADGSVRKKKMQIGLDGLDLDYLIAAYRSIAEADRDGLAEAIVYGENEAGKLLRSPLKSFFTIEINTPNGEVWVHEEGGWFIVDEHYRSSVKLTVNSTCEKSRETIRTWAIQLIDYDQDVHGDEAGYNRALAEANSHLETVFLDEPGGRIAYQGSTIELGDVFFARFNLLLHVKIDTSFGPVSKVCEQAGRAAELLAGDPNFRKSAEEFLSEKAGRTVSLINDRHFHWGVAIIKSREREFPGCLKYRAEECLHDFVHKISASGNVAMILAIDK